MPTVPSVRWGGQQPAGGDRQAGDPGGAGTHLLLSIFVLVVLIGRRLIKRLDLLGQELDRVAAGRLDVPVSTCGRDEIGRLGDSLRHFSPQLQQMERANALNLINNTQACLITCHPDGTIESVNPARSPCSSRPASNRASRCGRPFRQRRGDAGRSVQGGPAAAPVRPQRVHPGLWTG